MGYYKNEYYWCVMIKNVKGKHCNILWYVEYLNMLHVDYGIVSSVPADINT